MLGSTHQPATPAGGGGGAAVGGGGGLYRGYRPLGRRARCPARPACQSAWSLPGDADGAVKLFESTFSKGVGLLRLQAPMPGAAALSQGCGEFGGGCDRKATLSVVAQGQRAAIQARRLFAGVLHSQECARPSCFQALPPLPPGRGQLLQRSQVGTNAEHHLASCASLAGSCAQLLALMPVPPSRLLAQAAPSLFPGIHPEHLPPSEGQSLNWRKSKQFKGLSVCLLHP